MSDEGDKIQSQYHGGDDADGERGRHHQEAVTRQAEPDTLEYGGDSGQRSGDTRVAGTTLEGATYGMLLVLGFVVGLYGAFYSMLVVAGVPVAAIGGVVAIFAVCLTAGRVMRRRLGSVLPAVGWLGAVIALSSPRPEGDLVIVGTSGGAPAWGSYLLLFGGTVAAALAVATSQLGLSRRI